VRGARALALAAALLAASHAVAASIQVPYLSGRVNDEAEVLRPETRQALANLLQQHEARTGAQVVVLTVPSLGDASVEDYAETVFKEWKLGRKGQDDGVLLVVAPSERRMRVEVGYGLEGKLTDAAAGRILRNVIAPRFREGDFDRGVAEGVNAILDQLEGRAAPPGDGDGPERPAAEEKRSSKAFFDGPDIGIAERILIGAFVFGIIGIFTVIAVLTPGAGWFLYFFLIPFWAMFPIIVVGTRGALYLLVTYVVGFPLAKIIASRQPWYARAKRDLATKGKASVGGFTLTSGGSGGRSSWSSGGSSGGGFSGGGGSSGGGGASSSW
jgi:uncharacterized protein